MATTLAELRLASNAALAAKAAVEDIGSPGWWAAHRAAKAACDAEWAERARVAAELSARTLAFGLDFDIQPTDRPGFPTKKPGRGAAGWSVAVFATVEEMRAFMRTHPDAALPCWARK